MQLPLLLSLFLVVAVPSAASNPETRQQDQTAPSDEWEATLLRDPTIQELKSQIESSKNEAEQHLNVVRDWLSSEISFIRSWGAEHPTLELANTMRGLERLASELDPNGENAAAMKYLWIHALDGGPVEYYWDRGWNRLEDALEDGSAQEEIRALPLHPYSILAQVEPLRISGTTNFNQPPRQRSSAPRFFPDRPKPVLVALSETGEVLQKVVAIMAKERDSMELRRPWSDADRERRNEENARPLGGSASFSPDRLASAQNARDSEEEIWNQWTLANKAVRDMVNRIRAMEAFRQ